MRSDVMSVSEAARELDVAPQTVRNWVDTGKLSARRTIKGQRILESKDVKRLRVARERERESTRA